MNNIIYIYILKEPRFFHPEFNKARYVGVSKNPTARLKSHLYDIDRFDTYKTKWLKKLKELELIPILEIIDTANEDNWIEKEIQWISYYKETNHKLTNSTDGGEGFLNLSEESKIKISNARKGWIGNKNPFYGRTHSDCSKKIMRDSKLGILRKKTSTNKQSETISGRKRLNSVSDFIGVSWSEQKLKWRVRINIPIDRKSIEIGFFEDELMAAKTYDFYAKILFEHPKLNFSSEYI